MVTSRTKGKLIAPAKKPAQPSKKELAQKLMSLGHPGKKGKK